MPARAPIHPTASARPIRVASVPAAHPYVRGLGAKGVVRLTDPVPDRASAGRWWPPVMVDPAWVAAHAEDFDVLHLHFGTESFGVEHLERTVAALRDARRPLVYTVHDLSNPQLADQAHHVAQLDVLIPAADALVTLTPGAAAEVQRRWGRRAEVVAHPSVLPLEVAAPAGRAGGERVVGVHLRDLRPNVDGPGATAALLRTVSGLRATGAAVTARIELHDVVRDPGARDAVRALCHGVPWATLVERPRPLDAELWRSVADLDVSVLPYAHGTHSGWAELCWDLGVAVAAPDVGHVGEQHGPEALQVFPAGSGAGLARALRTLLPGATRPGSGARVALQARRRAERRTQHAAIATAHEALYRRVLGDELGPRRAPTLGVSTDA